MAVKIGLFRHVAHPLFVGDQIALDRNTVK